jgi:hypothetical protein
MLIALNHSSGDSIIPNFSFPFLRKKKDFIKQIFSLNESTMVNWAGKSQFCRLVLVKLLLPLC